MSIKVGQQMDTPTHIASRHWQSNILTHEHFSTTMSHIGDFWFSYRGQLGFTHQTPAEFLRFLLKSDELFTDHKALTYVLNSKPDRYSPREVRHLDYLSQFTSDIRHISGKDNVVADAFSRIEISALHTSKSIDLVSKAQDQKDDNELSSLLDDTSSLTLPLSPSTIGKQFSRHFTTYLTLASSPHRS